MTREETPLGAIDFTVNDKKQDSIDPLSVGESKETSVADYLSKQNKISYAAVDYSSSAQTQVPAIGDSPYSPADSQYTASTAPIQSQSQPAVYSKPQPQQQAATYATTQPQQTAAYSTSQPPQQTVAYPDTRPQQQPQSSYTYAGSYQTHAAASSATNKPVSAKKSFAFGFLGAFLACVLAFSGFGVFTFMTSSPSANTGNSPSVILGSSTSTDIIQASENTTLAEVVAEKALPSVVSIYVYTTQSMQGFGGMFGYNPYGYGSDNSSDGELVQSAMGSGVILSKDGYVLTNYHVVEGAEDLEVSVDGAAEPYKATIVGYDESSDIAVIKLENANDLTPVEIGDSSDLSVGEWVMALGSPYGLEQSISTGIISAVSRSYAMESTTAVTLYTNLIQTDAAINQGNSGGALVDADGKLIGINTLISSSSGDSSGVGFAIPVDYAIGIAEAIISGKTPSHAQLGVSLSDMSTSAAARYNLSESEGAYVAEVVEGKAAEQAGIKAGDIITKFGGTAVTSTSDLMLAVRSYNPGDTVDVELNRSGETITLKVTLSSDAS